MCTFIHLRKFATTSAELLRCAYIKCYITEYAPYYCNVNEVNASDYLDCRTDLHQLHYTTLQSGVWYTGWHTKLFTSDDVNV